MFVFFLMQGDSLIRYYEITNEAPYVHFLTLYQSNSPQRGIGFMPKRGLNVNNNEIARWVMMKTIFYCGVTILLLLLFYEYRFSITFVTSVHDIICLCSLVYFMLVTLDLTLYLVILATRVSYLIQFAVSLWTWV